MTGSVGKADGAAKPSGKSWNDGTKAQFLEHLAELCSVRAAVAALGMAVSGAYALRQKDTEFAAQWDAALDIGYARLEHELLDRAVNGQPREVMNRSGEVVVLREISNRLGLALLKLHHVRVMAIRAHHGAINDDDAAAARANILEKLERLANHRTNQIARTENHDTG